MFLLNVGHRWNLATDMDEVRGLVFLPSGNDSGRMVRSASLPECQRLLFDPQLYLTGLDCDQSARFCARLATYPWFGVEAPEFDSGAMTRREWLSRVQDAVAENWTGHVTDDVARACSSAIEFQISLGCTHVIFPSPLITEREDEAVTQALWLDESLRVAEESDVARPLLATVALSQATLNEDAFAAAGFLDSVVDQVSAREGVDGAYIVIAQTHAVHPFVADELVVRAYLYLSRAFARSGLGIVITNFADVIGLACMGVGATGFATGPSHALRRLCLAGFRDQGGGVALPRFYSHRVIAELLSETDLEVVMRSRLLRRVQDRTPYSAALMDELSRGGSASALMEWAESQNNLTASHKHFIARLSEEEHSVAPLAPREKAEHVRGWIEDADANAMYLTRRLGSASLQAALAPAGTWLAQFDACTALSS